MYLKTIKDKNLIYKDNFGVEIEVIINEDPILDVENKQSLKFFLENTKFFDFIIKDIQKEYRRMYYLPNEYDQNFEKLITTYDFKIMTYRVDIPYQNQDRENKLSNIKDKSLWEEYMLKNINELYSKNSKYLKNETYREYRKEHLDFMLEKDRCEVLYFNNELIGSICYNLYNDNYIYLRDVYGNTKEIIREILEMILTKYKRNIILDIVFMNKELKEIIKNLNGKITSVVYVWKREN